jgi:hypothetical protein
MKVAIGFKNILIIIMNLIVLYAKLKIILNYINIQKSNKSIIILYINMASNIRLNY